MAEIADNLDIPIETLRTWSTAYKWPAKRRKVMLELQEDVDADCTRIIRRAKKKVITRHLDGSQKLEDAIIKHIDAHGEINAKNLEALSKALNQSTAVSARVIGIDKAGKGEGLGIVNINKALVQVGVSPRIPGPDDEDDSFINVDEVEPAHQPHAEPSPDPSTADAQPRFF